MSAELLRKAAALMRERAEAATCTYVKDHPDPAKAGQPVPWFDAADAYSFDDADGPHIIGMSPAVALAVADWLESTANDVEHVHSPIYNLTSTTVARAIHRRPDLPRR